MSHVFGRHHNGVARYRQISRILEEELRIRYRQGQGLPSGQELTADSGDLPLGDAVQFEVQP